MDDAYNYLRLRGLTANHCTIHTVPTYEELYSSSLLGNEHPGATQLCRSGVNGSDSPLRPKLLLWLAADEDGLARIQEAYNLHFRDSHPVPVEEQVYMENLAYTLALRRSSLPWKSFAIANSLSVLRNQGLSLSKPVRSSRKLGLAYIFTGQGSHFAEMGRDLLVYPVFKTTLLRAESCLRDFGCKWSLLGIFPISPLVQRLFSHMFADELLGSIQASKINQPEYSQPLCTALQIALVELLRSWNVKLSAVIGHSSGEIAAALV